MSFVAVILGFFFVFTQSMFHSKNGCFVYVKKYGKKIGRFCPLRPTSIRFLLFLALTRHHTKLKAMQSYVEHAT
jgi:hypothetical protein